MGYRRTVQSGGWTFSRRMDSELAYQNRFSLGALSLRGGTGWCREQVASGTEPSLGLHTSVRRPRPSMGDVRDPCCFQLLLAPIAQPDCGALCLQLKARRCRHLPTRVLSTAVEYVSVPPPLKVTPGLLGLATTTCGPGLGL